MASSSIYVEAISKSFTFQVIFWPKLKSDCNAEFQSGDESLWNKEPVAYIVSP